MACHKDDTCERCHFAEEAPPPPPFDHASTGWILSAYHRDRSCRICHTDVPFVALTRDCNGCHSGWTPANFNHAVTGQVLDERHAPMECEVCHTERRFDRPPACTECHEDDGIGFPHKSPGAKLKPAGG
jgi:hypothetical protein